MRPPRSQRDHPQSSRARRPVPRLASTATRRVTAAVTQVLECLVGRSEPPNWCGRMIRGQRPVSWRTPSLGRPRGFGLQSLDPPDGGVFTTTACWRPAAPDAIDHDGGAGRPQPPRERKQQPPTDTRARLRVKVAKVEDDPTAPARHVQRPAAGAADQESRRRWWTRFRWRSLRPRSTRSRTPPRISRAELALSGPGR